MGRHKSQCNHAPNTTRQRVHSPRTLRAVAKRLAADAERLHTARNPQTGCGDAHFPVHNKQKRGLSVVSIGGYLSLRDLSPKVHLDSRLWSAFISE